MQEKAVESVEVAMGTNTRPSLALCSHGNTCTVTANSLAASVEVFLAEFQRLPPQLWGRHLSHPNIDLGVKVQQEYLGGRNNIEESKILEIFELQFFW